MSKLFPFLVATFFLANLSGAQEMTDDWKVADPPAESSPVRQPDSEARLQGQSTPINLSVAARGNSPKLTMAPLPARPVNLQSPKSISFISSDFAHRRLLFEEPLLERHGLTRSERLQPFISGAHFFGSAALFSSEVIKGHHRRCDSSLGWGKPGSVGGANRCNCR